MFRPVVFGLALLLLLPANRLTAQVYEGVELARASLIADSSGVVPGKTLKVGVLIDLAPGWHVYWKNPGDAGMPTTLNWELPEGFEIGEIAWPIPMRIIEPGDLQVFGYKEKVLLMQTISVPSELADTEAALRLRANWLVCEDICVPGEAELELTLPVKTEAEEQNSDLFEEWQKRLPATSPPPFPVNWEAGKGFWSLELQDLPSEAKKADFFAGLKSEERAVHTGAVEMKEGRATLEIPSEGPAEGLLVLSGMDPAQGWPVSSPEGLLPTAEEEPTEEALLLQEVPPASEYAIPLPPLNLWTALMFGMIGGLILNLMPCVLPVISLKIFGFIRQAGETRLRIFGHGMAFTAGIFLWFLGLAAIIALLRASGDQVTWAFQFQNPWFNLVIAVVVFVFALNLFGLFEIALPGAAGSKMSNLAEKEGFGGSFFQGIFATLLATPCTAPFLGTALGFAFSQPTVVIFAMFASVAFGMALPYIILSALPAWIRFLPKPGAWMEKLKQFMGFPLIATMVWLLSVVGGQKGSAGIIWAASLLTCLAFACWLYGAFCCGGKTATARWVAGILALFSVIGGSWFFGSLFARAELGTVAAAQVKEGDIDWVPFTQAKLDELLEEGESVFLDFTADWCITCKFNERTAINTPAVRALLQERSIIPMKADWTNPNPEIQAALQKFGRVGVPFYLFYPKGDQSDPIILPELLTEAIVLERLGGAQ